MTETVLIFTNCYFKSIPKNAITQDVNLDQEEEHQPLTKKQVLYLEFDKYVLFYESLNRFNYFLI